MAESVKTAGVGDRRVTGRLRHIVASQGRHALLFAVGSGVFRYAHHDLCLFFARDQARRSNPKPGVSPSTGIGRVRVPLFQQLHHPPGRKATAAQFAAGFLVWWGLTIMLGIIFLAGTVLEWYDLIGKWGLTDQPQSFRHHVFHAGRFPRVARDGRCDCHEYHLWPGLAPTPYGSQPDGRAGCRLVLAFRGRGLGRCLYSGVCRRAMTLSEKSPARSSDFVE